MDFGLPGHTKHMYTAIVFTSTGGDVGQSLSAFPKKRVLWEEIYQPPQHKMKQASVETAILLKYILNLMFKNKCKFKRQKLSRQNDTIHQKS